MPVCTAVSKINRTTDTVSEFDWGIQFDEEYSVPENGNRKVAYAEKNGLLQAVVLKYHPDWLKEDEPVPEDTPAGGQEQDAPAPKRHKYPPQKKRPVKPVAPHNREYGTEVTRDGPA